MDKKLVILDGSSLIYRAFFALPSLTTADGTPTNAVYGFTTMLLKLLEDEKPDVLLLALEGGRTFRHDVFSDYKATRQRTPDDLAVQTPLARSVAEGFRVPILQHRGYEADDVLGTIACRGYDAGYRVLVVTGDLDALQLVNDRVSVLVNRRGVTDAQVYDEAAVRERFGLPPALLPDFKALKGDTSDNIPGIAGIGDKTATALLQEYGSLENLLDHAEEVKAARVRTGLVEGRENARMYREIATIVTDLPLEAPLDEWAYQGPDIPRLRELFYRLEFRTLGSRLSVLETPPEEIIEDEAANEVPWRAVEGEEAAEWLGGALDGEVAVRTLQTSGEGRRGVLRGLAMSASGETVVLGCPEEDPAAGEGGLFAEPPTPWELPGAVARLLDDPKAALVGHDLKRDLRMLAGSGGHRSRPAFDTLLAAYVLNPGRSSYRLEDLTRDHLRRGLGGDGPEALAREARAIADLRAPLAARLKEEELEEVFYRLELPLIPILERIEAAGVAVDCAELRRLSDLWAGRIAELETRCSELANRPFTLGSPKQLREILFEELGLPAGRKTKTGYSTDSDVLQDLAVHHALPGLILEWRELSKLKSTYADALQSLVDPQTGRIHTRLNQAVAATGRLSSSDPNLQNIPIRTQEGREIRAAFIAAPGMALLSADYSQIELRIMAHISRDEELVRAFEEDRDVHAATGASVYGVPIEEVTADQRRAAKTMNFAVLYGQREFGLSRQLRIPIGEARSLIEAYFAQFPGVRRYAEETVDTARRYGYVCTLPPYSRKRYVPGIHAGNRNERMAAEREAVNAPVQGTAADVIKAAMLAVDAAMRREGLRSRMILQVHDELLFEIDPAEEERMRGLVRSEMEGAYPLDVPLRVDVKTGSNWRDVESGAVL